MFSLAARACRSHRLPVRVSQPSTTPRPSQWSTSRRFTTNTNVNPNVRPKGPRSKARITVALTSGAALSLTLLLAPSIRADEAHALATPQLEALARVQSERLEPSLASLLRTYAVYSMCSVPVLVDHAPDVLAVLMAIPGVRQLTEAFVRVTFFAQVGTFWQPVTCT